MRTVHRIITLFVAVFLLYLGITGTGIQLIDLRTLLSNAPASDPDMMAIREGHDGPGSYAVRTTGDFTVPALPAGFDFQTSMATLMTAARSLAGDAQLDYAEVRMQTSGPVGLVATGKQQVQMNFASGETSLAPLPKPEPQVVPSTRNTIKQLHRMTTLGDWPLWINPVVSIALGVLVVTGIVMYLQLLFARRRTRRRELFWFAGGWWRSLHRWLSICAAAFIMIVALSGSWLAYESLAFGLYLRANLPVPGQPRTARPSPISALQDADLPAMLDTTLKAVSAHIPDQPIKVLRLRIYGGMPQGVVIAGLDNDTMQLVFNALDGRRVTETEPGYPETGFPFGWRAHQIAKDVHRGDFIGMPGRWMSLFAGLSVVFLTVSGLVMYIDMYRRRRRAGRASLLWK